MQESAQGTAGEIQAIREVIGRVDSAVASIAISVEEQSRTTQGITHDLGAATASVRDTSGEILRAAESVDGIAAQVKQVQKRSELVRDIARQSAKRGEEVDKVAETLVDQLGNFNMSP
jgi:methyl-accepting chemotaxis protein